MCAAGNTNHPILLFFVIIKLFIDGLVWTGSGEDNKGCWRIWIQKWRVDWITYQGCWREHRVPCLFPQSTNGPIMFMHVFAPFLHKKNELVIFLFLELYFAIEIISSVFVANKFNFKGMFSWVENRLFEIGNPNFVLLE